MRRVHWPHKQPMPASALRGIVAEPIGFSTPQLRALAQENKMRAGTKWAVIKPKQVSRGILFEGVPYYWTAKGYYRAGRGDRRPLQQIVWERQNRRALPAGHEIFFKDRDRHNFERTNLEALSKAELHHRTVALGEVAQLTFEERKKISGKRWTNHARGVTALLLKKHNENSDCTKFLGTRKRTFIHGPRREAA